MKKALILILVVAAVAGGLAYYKLKVYPAKHAEAAQKEFDAITDLEDGAEVAAKLDGFIAEYGDVASLMPKANYYRFAYYSDTEKPDGEKLFEYAQAADAASKDWDRRERVLNAIAFAFAERNQHLDSAEAWAREALTSQEKDGEEYDIANAKDTLGYVLMRQGKNEEAYPLLQAAAEAMPDEASVLGRAGGVSEALGKKEESVDYYLKSLAVFGNDDQELFESNLKPLYVAVKGSDAGLAEQLDKLKAEARQYAIFDSRKVDGDKAAPEWKLPALDGSEGVLSALDSGKVMFVKFWGFW